MRLSLVPRGPRGFLNRTWGGREAQVTAAGVGGARALHMQQRLPGGGLEGPPGPDHQSWKKKTCGFHCENNESLKRALEAQVTGLSWRSERALDSSVGDSGLTPPKQEAGPPTAAEPRPRAPAALPAVCVPPCPREKGEQVGAGSPTSVPVPLL